MRNIVLTTREYQYLVNNLLEHRKEIIERIDIVSNEDSIEITLNDDDAYDIRELASDEMGMNCFDENYEPTEEGWILEHFIDKFF